MKTAAIILLAVAVFRCAAQAQWNGGACDRPVNVTVNRYNYYGTSAWAPAYGYGGWNNYAPWGYNGFGQPVPNGLGWTLYDRPVVHRLLPAQTPNRSTLTSDLRPLTSANGLLQTPTSHLHAPRFHSAPLKTEN